MIPLLTTRPHTKEVPMDIVSRTERDQKKPEVNGTATKPLILRVVMKQGSIPPFNFFSCGFVV